MAQAISCGDASIEDLKAIFYRDCPLYEMQTVIAGIHTIATHYEPHNDEIASSYLLQKTPQGEFLFPGIKNASVGPISATKLREHGFYGEEGFFKALQKGILLIGIGHGPLDEHGDLDKKISCTQLIVELLDLYANKEDRVIYGNLIKYINFEDRNGDDTVSFLNKTRDSSGGQRLTKEEAEGLIYLKSGNLAQNLKKGFEVAIGNDVLQTEIFKMAYMFYDNEIQQAKIFQKASKEYAESVKAKVDLKIPGAKGDFVLLHMKSDNILMGKVVRSKWREGGSKTLGVLFIEKSNGQFALLPNRVHITATNMREVVKVLRQTIALNREEAAESIDFCDLGKNQVIESVPEIHFDENTGIISNGSKTDPDVPGLLGKSISPQEVIRAIRIGLDTEYFPSDFAKNCIKGICAKSRCPIYQFSQNRCHEIRKNQKGTLGIVIEKALNKKTV
jgi:hypothetical protein